MVWNKAIKIILIKKSKINFNIFAYAFFEKKYKKFQTQFQNLYN